MQQMTHPSPPALDFEQMSTHAETAARFMRAMGNAHRLMLLCALSEGELSVSQLNARIPLSQSALSQHLAVLREEQLVTTRRESQNIFYCVAPGPAMDVVRLLHQHFCAIPSGDCLASPSSSHT